MKTFKFKMADNNVLFATLLALVTSLIAWVEVNFFKDDFLGSSAWCDNVQAGLAIAHDIAPTNI